MRRFKNDDFDKKFALKNQFIETTRIFVWVVTLGIAFVDLDRYFKFKSNPRVLIGFSILKGNLDLDSSTLIRLSDADEPKPENISPLNNKISPVFEFSNGCRVKDDERIDKTDETKVKKQSSPRGPFNGICDVEK
uniref:Uncharacterized protein n=1 Tax=Romanomermis culicivorax TaxID=13658 RepID=A0A915JCL2_ROMCU